MKPNLPDPGAILGREIPDHPGYEFVEHIDSGGNAHVFRAHSSELNFDFACKVIPRANLVGVNKNPPTWRQEIDKANVLPDLVVKFTAVIDPWECDGSDCIVLVSEYVKGKSLEAYRNNPEQISIPFVERFLASMFSLLKMMKDRRIEHGDLHLRNILVQDKSEVLGSDPYAFRVTDFGVARATSSDRFKDDYDQVASMLKQLLQKVDYQAASPKDKHAFNILNDHFLARHLTERDPTRDPIARDPEGLFQRLAEIDEEYQSIRQRQAPSVSSPFDFLSCEQIGEDHGLLRSLYSSLFLGVEEIEGRHNLVLTGPRGCGKSTVFKCLSLRHRYSVKEDFPESISYFGVYYRCDDLYAAFPRYRHPGDEEAVNLPIHFLVSAMLEELLQTVELWLKRYFKDDWDRMEGRASKKLWDVLGLTGTMEPRFQTFRALITRLGKERQRAARKQRFLRTKERFGHYFGPEILSLACRAVRSTFPSLEEIPIYFFVDDYSIPKITKDLQRSLNRVLMQRTAECFFKISTESPVSYEQSDMDGKSYVEGREYQFLNLGLVFLKAGKSQVLAYLTDVFERRFKLASSFPVKSLRLLVGSCPETSYNEVAMSLRSGERPECWGVEMLCDLCSGDVFYIISLLGRMVHDADVGIDVDDEPVLEKKIQQRAIRGEAGKFLTSLRGIHRGEHLVAVVTSFANVAYSYIKFRNSGNKDGNPPHQASRIEPYHELDLSQNALEIYTELLRYSLFIEDPRGKSRRGRVVPRLYLRRALLPHFNLTFSKRDSISLENYEIEQLLLEPKAFEANQRLPRKGNDDRVDLFEGKNNGSR